MYFKSSESELVIEDSRNSMLAIILSVLVIILLGVFPGTFIDLVTKFI